MSSHTSAKHGSDKSFVTAYDKLVKNKFTSELEYLESLCDFIRDRSTGKASRDQAVQVAEKARERGWVSIEERNDNLIKEHLEGLVPHALQIDTDLRDKNIQESAEKIDKMARTFLLNDILRKKRDADGQVPCSVGAEAFVGRFISEVENDTEMKPSPDFGSPLSETVDSFVAAYKKQLEKEKKNPQVLRKKPS